MSQTSRSRGGAAAKAVAASLLLSALPAAAHAAPPAAGAPGQRHAWTEADKHGFGTATSRASEVWFTLRSAELSEVYFPDLSTPSLRSLEFVVTDGRTFADRETDAGVTSHVRPVRGSLAFRQTTSTSRWSLTKTWSTDPRRDTVLADVRLRSRTGGPLQLYVLADPAPGDDGNDDRGRTRGSTLVAWDDTAASAIAATPALRDGTSGYKGTASDPWTALGTDRRLGAATDARAPGNVVQAARTAVTGVRGSRHLRLAIGFGADPGAARTAARESLRTRAAVTMRRFERGWSAFLRSVKDPPASVAGDAHLRSLYQQSLMVLAASEDKRNRGAFVASPTMPWVWGKLTLEKTETSEPYHLVWPRDQYHIATALEAAGDHAGALRALDYLWRTQKPAGDWWQNTEVDTDPHWTDLQMDQVALPIVLSWWLKRTGATDWTHVQAAADFLVANGPRTRQERWENQDGYSPNTIATEIAGLVCAAEIARANGDAARADRYLATADDWQRQVQAWTATTNGPYSADPYYLRIVKDTNPNDGTTFNLGDNFPRPVDEREIVDPSFLGLVLFGAKRWDDPVVRNTLSIVDRTDPASGGLRVETPNGPVWHRFSFDGYGETRDGADWDIFPTAENQTLGRAWPLLIGERGEYELLAGHDATPYLRTIGGTANDGLMLPEQVWDGRPPTGPDAPAGEGTRSATPLAWTHGAFLRLAWSIDAGHPVERPTVVACRYAGATGC